MSPAREEAGPSPGVSGAHEDAGKPFSGLVVVCVDYSDTGISVEEFSAYKEKVEGLGGILVTGIQYKQATHIVVKGNIPPGARILWEGDLKKVNPIEWVDSCYEESRLLPTEPKRSIENLISEASIMTPPSKKSHERKCISTSSKVLKHFSWKKSGIPRRLDYSVHHRHLKCTAETEYTESLYDYALRYRMHEYCEVPGCKGILICEEGNDIKIPTSLKVSKLTTKVILMRAFIRPVMLHDENFALGGKFSSRNFYIYRDDSVKLDGIAEGAIVSYSDAAADLDYDQFVHVISNEVFLGQKIPFDLTEWLRIIYQGVKACGHSLLCNHIDLMEPFQGYGHFVAMFQQFWKIKDTAGGEDLMNSLAH